MLLALVTLAGCSSDVFKPIIGWDEECEASLEEYSALLEAAAEDLTEALGDGWSHSGPVCDTDSGPSTWYTVEPEGPVESSDLDAIHDRVLFAGWMPTSDITGPDASRQIGAGDRALQYVSVDVSDLRLELEWYRSTGVMALDVLSPEH